MRGVESQKNLLTIENDGDLEAANDFVDDQRSAAAGYQHTSSGLETINRH